MRRPKCSVNGTTVVAEPYCQKPGFCCWVEVLPPDTPSISLKSWYRFNWSYFLSTAFQHTDWFQDDLYKLKLDSWGSNIAGWVRGGTKGANKNLTRGKPRAGSQTAKLQEPSSESQRGDIKDGVRERVWPTAPWQGGSLPTICEQCEHQIGMSIGMMCSSHHY